MFKRLLIFGAINFVALAIGGLSTVPGVSSEWYLSLNQAPWTPPGWVFGFAWTLIMIFFSLYMALLWSKVEKRRTLVTLFILQWILNVSWNPLFFSLHFVAIAFVSITLLTALVAVFLFYYWENINRYSLLVLPYLLWLIIASSLNAYIFFNN